MYQVLYREYVPHCIHPRKLREDGSWKGCEKTTSGTTRRSLRPTVAARPGRGSFFGREIVFFLFLYFLGSASVAIFGDVNWKLP